MLDSSGAMAPRQRPGSGPLAIAQSPVQGPAPGCAVSLDRPTAVVVDDCRFLAQRVARVLEARGYACIVASDGYQALAAAGSRRCELFVVAVELAVVDGFAVLRRLREDPSYAGVPVVMLAADLDDLEHDREHALALGASAYLSKPLQLRSLNQALDLVARAQV